MLNYFLGVQIFQEIWVLFYNGLERNHIGRLADSMASGLVLTCSSPEFLQETK